MGVLRLADYFTFKSVSHSRYRCFIFGFEDVSVGVFINSLLYFNFNCLSYFRCFSGYQGVEVKLRLYKADPASKTLLLPHPAISVSGSRIYVSVAGSIKN